MPKGGNGGGGNGGGGNGGGDSGGGGSWRGGNGNDIVSVVDVGQLGSTTFDGRGGFDTLDMSALTTGVTIKLNNGSGSDSTLFPNREFTGLFHSFSLAVQEGRINDSVRNFEHLIGGSGDDFLYIDSSAAKIIEGGDGDDALGANGGNATLVGGAGSDVMLVYWDNNILVGGSYDFATGVATPDGESDTFIFGTSGTILDFEAGMDRLQIETNEGQIAGALAAEWQDTDDGAMLQVAGKTIILVGVTAAEASAIQLEFVIGGSGFTDQGGGPGNDVFYSFDSMAERYLLDSGSGHDTILFFDTASDTLVFADGAPASWEAVDVNGEAGIRGVYDGGSSSVTLLGLSLDDVGALLIEEPAGSPMALMNQPYGDALIL